MMETLDKFRISIPFLGNGCLELKVDLGALSPQDELLAPQTIKFAGVFRSKEPIPLDKPWEIFAWRQRCKTPPSPMDSFARRTLEYLSRISVAQPLRWVVGTGKGSC
jgi:hypothetical protein